MTRTTLKILSICMSIAPLSAYANGPFNYVNGGYDFGHATNWDSSQSSLVSAPAELESKAFLALEYWEMARYSHGNMVPQNAAQWVIGSDKTNAANVGFETDDHRALFNHVQSVIDAGQTDAWSTIGCESDTLSPQNVVQWVVGSGIANATNVNFEADDYSALFNQVKAAIDAGQTGAWNNAGCESDTLSPQNVVQWVVGSGIANATNVNFEADDYSALFNQVKAAIDVGQTGAWNNAGCGYDALSPQNAVQWVIGSGIANATNVGFEADDYRALFD